ncbi:hypothetical protein ACU686_30875 [Yinghuangia aomiensis]
MVLAVAAWLALMPGVPGPVVEAGPAGRGAVRGAAHDRTGGVDHRDPQRGAFGGLSLPPSPATAVVGLGGFVVWSADRVADGAAGAVQAPQLQRWFRYP